VEHPVPPTNISQRSGFFKQEKVRKQLLRGEDIQQASSLFSRTTHPRMEILFDSILTRFLVLLKPNNTIDLLMFHVKQKKPTRDC